MNALEKFHEELDGGNWNANEESEINKRLQTVNEELIQVGLVDIQHLAEVERQAFQFSKSPQKRLSFRVAGTQTLEDGSEVPFEWPDIRTFTDKDFEYLYQRFTNCKNLYAKSEFGLVLFYSNYKQDNQFVADLLVTIFSLSKLYLSQAKEDEKGHSIIYLSQLFGNAFYITNQRKADKEISRLYLLYIQYVFDIHQTWDIKSHWGLRTIVDLTKIVVQYFKDFVSVVDVEQFLIKNWEVAIYLSDKNLHGAIYVADVSISLCKKLGIDTSEWLKFKAGQYEKLAKDAELNENIASVTFVENAMEIYKGLKLESDLERIQQEYLRMRSLFHLGEVRMDMPEGESQRIDELIQADIRDSSAEEIARTLMVTPMIRPLEEIKNWSKDLFNEPMLQNLIPVSINDKFGNTIAQFESDEERERFSLLQTYDHHLQIAIQTIFHYFLEALKAEKISKDTILELLNQSWMGNVGSRRVNGVETEFDYLRSIEGALDSLFNELGKWKSDSNYVPNIIMATDSLILKAEYLLREMCRFLNLPTFKTKPKDPNIKMERTLDELLHELEGKLTDDDLFFIKFILTEKAGYNLRNRIAHGLMDDIDYGLEYSLLAIIVILKLSGYQFVTSENNLEE